MTEVTSTMLLWGVLGLVHILVASFATYHILKDIHCRRATRLVHFLLAWLFPLVGFAFSVDHIFSKEPANARALPFINKGGMHDSAYEHNHDLGASLGDGD